ncbi:MAG: hypothetical protein Q7T79_03905 [bacterium]|nr:hypothetical protein [bacterium]
MQKRKGENKIKKKRRKKEKEEEQEYLNTIYFFEEEHLVTRETYKRRDPEKICSLCGAYLLGVFSEKCLQFDNGCIMVMGIKTYGHECDSCDCCFILEA